MANRLWGCYSVRDHLEPRPFVADLLLYDRLLIPTPAPDDLDRWEEKWNPERQARLLDILGPLAERIVWDAPLREEWERKKQEAGQADESDETDLDELWSTGKLATDADSAYEWTRRVISEQLEEEVRSSGDVRAVAVYAKPDRFDRDWEIVRAPRFLQGRTTMTPGELTQVAGPAPAAHDELAKLVVTQLVVPDDGVDDEDALQRTVDLVMKPGVSERRLELHQLIASISAQPHIRDQTVVVEVREQLEALNDSVKKNTKRQVAHGCITGITWVAGGFALVFPPVGALAAPLAALGNSIVKRRYGSDPKAPPPGVGAAKLLQEAQQALASP